MKKKKGSLLSRTPNKPYRLFQPKPKRQFLIARTPGSKPVNMAPILFFALVLIVLAAAFGAFL